MKIIKKYPNIDFIGSGALVHKDVLSHICLDNNIHAKNVGICGYNKYKNGLATSADNLLPLYLRKSQAERMKSINE